MAVKSEPGPFSGSVFWVVFWVARFLGPWANGLAEAGEDDPLIATSSAAGALAICRRALMGDNVNSASECLGPGGPRM